MAKARAGERYVVEDPVLLPGKLRAGTRLDHRFVETIRIGDKNHGSVDPSQRVYQQGGEAKKFVRWSAKAISIPEIVWRQIQGRVDWIEMIDRPKNQCYRCSLPDARQYGHSYVDPRIGPRYAIPLRCFDLIDVNWIVLQAREVP